MKDWKGNEIQVSHTVLIIDINNSMKGGGSKTSILFYGKDGSPTYRSDVFVTIPLKDDWEICQEIEVVEKSDKISCGWTKTRLPINHVDSWVCAQPWQIICIKGISDNKEEYFNSK